MAQYKFNDIEKAVLSVGYVKIPNCGPSSGSHFKYEHPATGLTCVLVKDKEISPGVAKKNLDMVVLQARISNINIGRKSYGLSPAVYDYILRQHAKCKENPLNSMPDDIKKVQTPPIKTAGEMNGFIKNKTQSYKNYMRSHSDNGMGS